MLPIIPSATPDSSGTSLSDRMTSPLFLMGLGLLTGGLQGRGLTGLTAGASAAAQFGQARAAQQKAEIERRKLAQSRADRARVNAALLGIPGQPAGAGLPTSTSAPVTGAPAGSSPAAAGTVAPTQPQGDSLAAVQARINALMPLALQGVKPAADAVRLLQSQFNALQPKGSDIARIVEANYGPNWRTSPEGLAEFERLKKLSATNVSMSSNPFFSRAEVVTDPDGSRKYVGMRPDGTVFQVPISGATKTGKNEQAAQAYIDTALPIAKDIEQLLKLSEGGPIPPYTAEAGRAKTLLFSAVTALSSERGLGAISKDDKQILFGMLGDDPTTWKAQIQNMITRGGWSEQQTEQLRTMYGILMRNIGFYRGRLSSLSPSGRSPEAEDLQRRVDRMSDEEARNRLRALQRKQAEGG